MAIIKTDNAHYKKIADVVREKFGTDETYTPDYLCHAVETACNYQRDQGYEEGHEAGYEEGHEAGYEEGYNAGKAEGGDVVDHDPIPATATGIRCVSVNDVSEIPHDVSVQLSSDTIKDFSGVTVTRVGKNLLPFPYKESSKTFNGITWTVNDDGTIIANGTARGDSYFILVDKSPYSFDVGQCFISGCPSDGSTSTYYLRSVQSGHTDIGQGIAMGLATKYWVFRIVIVNGYTANSLIFKPQIELGTVATEYEPYAGNAHSANENGTVSGVTSTPLDMTVFADADVSLTVGYNKSKGVQIVYDMFWDAYQQNGTRAAYDCAFYGRCWTDELFKPKYKMIPTNMSQCFYGANNITRDLTADMIDTSRCTNLYFAFAGLMCAHLPVIDMRAVTAYSSARYPFYNCTRLKTIEGLYLPQVGVEKPFHNCESLREVRLLGDGKFLSDVDMGVCPLSKASIESVIAALSDTVTGQTATFNKTAVEASFTTEEWETLVATKPNWTITLTT